ncbi:hypothetical protein RvY_16223 [Ramazzottius varieornatus]|uniref:Uncharacterized protein n=1 Tax=Ramazzottius varieornatus TaxID=947166 RepID=A0A1D1VXP3_RAMVA|nr:hypothetical protein RvY_16223 [Ramazzottius varieornatus]
MHNATTDSQMSADQLSTWEAVGVSVGLLAGMTLISFVISYFSVHSCHKCVATVALTVAHPQRTQDPSAGP